MKLFFFLIHTLHLDKVVFYIIVNFLFHFVQTQADASISIVSVVFFLALMYGREIKTLFRHERKNNLAMSILGMPL